MQDLDFINNGERSRKTVGISGKIEGNNKQIQNIITNGSIFNNIAKESQVNNLFIKNYQSSSGVISTLYGDINNIHVSEIKIEKTTIFIYNYKRR